jgi:hypothetical protein
MDSVGIYWHSAKRQNPGGHQHFQRHDISHLICLENVVAVVVNIIIIIWV